MKRYRAHSLVVLLGITLSLPALAVNVTISGRFVEAGPEMPWIADLNFCNTATTPYEIVGPFSTDVGGTYQVRDSGATTFSADTVLTFYQGMPNLNNLAANRVAVTDEYGLANAIDNIGSITLAANTDYYVLAQPFCGVDANGVWGQLFLGPGTITGDQVAATPAHWQGTWSQSDGLTNLTPDPGCPQTYYDVAENITFDQSGTWYISVSSGYDGRPSWINIYDGPFDPDSPQDNLVTFIPVGGPFEIEAGTYTLVTSGVCDFVDGDWYYVMWPPAPFELNSGNSATYYDTATSGQGQLVHINQDNFVFLAWFTYDSAPVAAEIRPQSIGNSGQRWLTMAGTFEDGDTSVELAVYAPEGVGVFNQPPVVGVEQVGTATMDMESCSKGELRFDLDSGESGTAIMNLLVGDTDHCEGIYRGPWVLYE